MAVRKTTLAIDDELLAQARDLLGTETMRETVEAALREVIRQEVVERHIEWLKANGDRILEARELARRETAH